MSKKTNTLIFLLGATVVNIIITVICFLAFLVLFSRFLFPLFPEDSIAWVLPVIFVLSIVASVLIYRMMIKFLMKKVDMNKYFDPIFNRRPPPRKP